MTTLEDIKTLAKRTALLVLLADIVHCYRYVSNYYAEDKEETEEEKRAQDEHIMARYSCDCAPETVVSNAEFERCVQEALDHLEKEADGQDVVKSRLAQTHMMINREAIVFAGGGRAALLQLAHPFVAAGIRDHSYLQRGVSKRFFNTFRLMFGLGFGEGPEIVKAAKTIRGLHNKVHGTIQEDVGVFTPKAKFDANQKDAMRFVQWTLADAAVFEYELHVRWLTTEEKDSVARSSAKFLLLFGVPEELDEDKLTWKQFRRRLDAMYRSKLLTVSDTAMDTQEFMLLPPSPLYAPVMQMLRWSTFVSMPQRIAQQYGGRRYDTQLDLILFAIYHGFTRFFYRLLPGSFRYLTAYWDMYERAYGPRNAVSKFFSSLSASSALFLAKMLMPDRDPEKAVAQVKEIRAQRGPMDKLEEEAVTTFSFKV